jgi:hypothetical protein
MKLTFFVPPKLY